MYVFEFVATAMLFEVHAYFSGAVPVAVTLNDACWLAVTVIL